MKLKKLSELQNEIETLEGSWELSPSHEVLYKERSRQPPDRRLQTAAHNIPTEKQASFKASIVAAEPDALVISVTTKEDEHHTTTGLVKLSGKWALDDRNRITFVIKKPFGSAQDRNKLTFQGAWEVNDNFQVTYTFSTRSVLSGSGKSRRRVPKITQELVFEGHWDISEKNCLTYLIGVDSDSAFQFRGTFEGFTQPQRLGTASARAGRSRPIRSIAAKAGAIRYQAGIEYKTSRGTKRRITQTITLFGKWKWSDDLALSFEIEYADGRRSEIRFGTELSLKKLQGPGLRRLLPDEVSVGLVSSSGKPLGIELVLTKDLFDGNAQAFVRLQRSIREMGVEAGIKIPW